MELCCILHMLVLYLTDGFFYTEIDEFFLNISLPSTVIFTIVSCVYLTNLYPEIVPYLLKSQTWRFRSEPSDLLKAWFSM